MKLLFTARTYLPVIGGLQESTHELITHLHALGHECEVLTSLQGVSGVRLFLLRARRKVFKKPFLFTTRDLGYPVHHVAHAGEGIHQLMSTSATDLIVVSGGGINTLKFSLQVLDARGAAPAAVYVRDVASIDILTGEHPPELVATNAEKLTDLASAIGREATTIPSVIDSERYQIRSTRETVLYINPVLSRGLDIAIETARLLPDIPFAFQQAWPMSPSDLRDLSTRLADLPNVELREQRHTPQELYGDARILFAPYIVENRPRVIHEAALSGIPTVATAAGGLIEATGPGGQLVAPEAAPREWAQAISTLWNDSTAYEQFSVAAVAHAGRAEMQPRHLAQRFLDFALS